MKPSRALAAFAAINKVKTVSADGNSFTSPLQDTSIHAGQTMEVTWNEPSGNVVNLFLLRGDPANLEQVATIGTGIENQGGIAWMLPDDIAPGKYALMINSDTGVSNYSPFFTVLDPVTPVNYDYSEVPDMAITKKSTLEKPIRGVETKQAAGSRWPWQRWFF